MYRYPDSRHLARLPIQVIRKYFRAGKHSRSKTIAILPSFRFYRTKNVPRIADQREDYLLKTMGRIRLVVCFALQSLVLVGIH
jgi:hypothetical protein